MSADFIVLGMFSLLIVVPLAIAGMFTWLEQRVENRRWAMKRRALLEEWNQ